MEHGAPDARIINFLLAVMGNERKVIIGMNTLDCDIRDFPTAAWW